MYYGFTDNLKNYKLMLVNDEIINVTYYKSFRFQIKEKRSKLNSVSWLFIF